MMDKRKTIIALIQQAQQSGARQSKACEVIGISAKTFQRWSRNRTDHAQDGRLEAKHEPKNKLTSSEHNRMIAIANEPA